MLSDKEASKTHEARATGMERASENQMHNHDSGFQTHRQAALALLSQCPNLSHKEAGFLGHVCVADALSDRQRDWLIKLLSRHGLPSLVDGGAL